MKVDGRHFRSIWLEDDGRTVGAIDQRRLPHEFVVARIASARTATRRIKPSRAAAGKSRANSSDSVFPMSGGVHGS